MLFFRFSVANESEKWEMEYRHLNERHQLAKTQLKETLLPPEITDVKQTSKG